jgi:glutaredoxin
MGKYLKGKYHPIKPQKYVGDVKKIIYRSSYEYKFCVYCDTTGKILRWNSEEIVVPYYNVVDKKMHRYFVDFWVEIKNNDGSINQYLIEVKPQYQTIEPKKKSRKSKKYLMEMKTWITNKAKWEAAKIYAEERNAKFLIFSERELGIIK